MERLQRVWKVLIDVSTAISLKRNIETWIHFLQGETVDEETEYSKYQKEAACKPSV
ncbi:MAG: hypothetical protein RH949_28070 [Coleofasciculus sp. A1-SPW-01]|uniref:hypothetical protein n=1 Tax=Coleofasciculus sp. A1-SPW-01 TaxID=3070819 RepID=UPI0032F0AB31